LPLIPEDKIAEVRDRTDIVQVIGEYVSLRRSGVNWKGLCPFHGEKTPSFNVNSAKQIFHCFGCGKSGDVIRFVMEHDAKPFIDVVRELARRAGVDLPEPELSPAAREAQRRAESDRARLLRVTRLAADFFRAQYAAPVGERARAYVEGKRGIGAEVRERFEIGYAPPGWDALVRHLEAQRVPHELAEAAGLVRAREKVARRPSPGAPPTRETHFDLFRDRVICPLLNAQGEVLAFSGRVMPDVERAAKEDPNAPPAPKYINSPETAIYRKGEQLYGLHVAKQAIRKAGRAILVEGNFDVLMMHQRGFAETVAPMGTAFTASQARLLHRAAPGKVYMLLDGDAAGGSAAARNTGIFLDEDLLSFVAVLPPGEDPDTFVAKHGVEAVELLLKKARESVDYFTEFVWQGTGLSEMEKFRLIEEHIAPILNKVKLPAARNRYADLIAHRLNLPPQSVTFVMRGGRPKLAESAQSSTPQAIGNGTLVEQPLVELDGIDLELVALLADHPKLLARPSEVLPVVGAAPLRAALEQLLAGPTLSSAKLDATALCELLDARLRSKVMAAAMSGRFAEVTDGQPVLASLSRRRAEQAQVVELNQLKKKVAQAREAGDRSRVEQLTGEIIQLERSRFGLKY